MNKVKSEINRIKESLERKFLGVFPNPKETPDSDVRDSLNYINEKGTTKSFICPSAAQHISTTDMGNGIVEELYKLPNGEFFYKTTIKGGLGGGVSTWSPYTPRPAASSVKIESKFKTGDRVKCIDARDQGPYMVLGKEYTVRSEFNGLIELEELGHNYGYFSPDRFELVEFFRQSLYLPPKANLPRFEAPSESKPPCPYTTYNEKYNLEEP